MLLNKIFPIKNKITLIKIMELIQIMIMQEQQLRKQGMQLMLVGFLINLMVVLLMLGMNKCYLKQLQMSMVKYFLLKVQLLIQIKIIKVKEKFLFKMKTFMIIYKQFNNNNKWGLD